MAQRFQFKRSSLQGKRPGPEYLEAGEIALNTNATDPGLYFESNDGSITKAGPTYIGPKPPTSQVGYGHGESWYDTSTGNIRTYDAESATWLKAVSPIHGGTTTVIYVGSEYVEANDSLENNGTARPFRSLNRACLEIARRSALLPNESQPYTGRFVIMLLPGENIVYNEPGISAEDFFANEFVYEDGQEVTADQFHFFNPESGGLILPRGASIVGETNSKTTLRPTDYPRWNRYSRTPDEAALTAPRSSILKITGNATVERVTFRDKIAESFVTDITGDPEDAAILVSLTPHGFRSLSRTTSDGSIVLDGDKVSFTYAIGIRKFYDDASIISELEEYYVQPIDAKRFYLLDIAGNYILRRRLPEDPAPGSRPSQYMKITTNLRTHHRLSAISYCDELDLQSYYDKVNFAFSKIDVYDTNSNNFRVVSGEVIIGPDITDTPTDQTDDFTELPAVVQECAVESNYGLCGITMDGDSVGGLKSLQAIDVSFNSFQTDPEVFDVYYDKAWRSLRSAYAQSIRKAEENVTTKEMMTWMANTVEIENMRYFYDFEKTTSGGSSGLPDDYMDTRHYGLLAKNEGVIHAALAVATGFAVNYWAQSGGELVLADSESRYCAQAIRAEGFKGINSSGGSYDPDQGFNVLGIRRPLTINKKDVEDPKNHKIQYLNSGIHLNDEDFRIKLWQPFDVTSLYPYTLPAGGFIYAERLDTGDVLKAKVDAVPAVTEDNYMLFDQKEYYIFLDPDENEFYGVDPKVIGLPYVKRFVDPRRPEDRVYSLWLENTSSDHRPPQKGSVLRLAEKPGAGKTDILVFGRQFDPGENGGWNHVFSVVNAETSQDGNNPNTTGNKVISTTTGEYYVDLKLCDSYGQWVNPLQPRASDPYNLDRRQAAGAFTAYEDRIFYSKTNELRQVSNLKPTESNSSWELSRTWEKAHKRENVLFSSNNEVGDDPFNPLFSGVEHVSYVRGLAIERENYELTDYIDYDDGTDSFGLVEGNEVKSELSDPAFSPSKQAIMRFLRLLGFNIEEIEPLLRPKKWSERNLSVLNFPELFYDGYAKDKGKWPVEFNTSSHVFAANHHWHWSGYVNYSKGLPNYQNSPLPRRQRFDALSTEVWGGTVHVSGQDNLGVYVLNNIDGVDSRGEERQG